MAVRQVVKLGNPILRNRSAEIAADCIKTREIQTLIEDMIETMRAYRGVGLAAPQIDCGLRVIVYEVNQNERYPGRTEIPLRALINPQFAALGERQASDWEGCLSIPELRGLTPRHTEIQVNALDRNGAELNYRAADFEARIIQHEIDHLDGIVFLDRMIDLRALAYTEELEKLRAGK